MSHKTGYGGFNKLKRRHKDRGSSRKDRLLGRKLLGSSASFKELWSSLYGSRSVVFGSGAVNYRGAGD